jgi:hypothetical protein
LQKEAGTGRWAFTELRIFPDIGSKGDEAGEWRGSMAPSESVNVPRGGLTSRVVHGIRVREHRLYAAMAFTEWAWEPFIRKVLEESGDRNRFPYGEKRPGRRGREPVQWARFAAEYDELVKKGGIPPIKELARRWKVSEATARDRIAHVRRMDPPLLTRPIKPGMAGGELTKEAKRLLRNAARKRGG